MTFASCHVKANRKNTVKFTKYQSAAELSKRYDLENGEIRKTPAAQMSKGTAKLITMDFAQFGGALMQANARTAFGYGTHDAGLYGERANIAVKGKANPNKCVLSRTQEYFQYRAEPGVMMTDHDPNLRGPSVTPEKLTSVISDIFPQFADAAMWRRGSVSAGVHRAGAQQQKITGFHLYTPVQDASDILRFGNVLFERLWLGGYGFIGISAAGTFLVRSIIDAAVYSGERLDFVGAPTVGDGLAWTSPEPVYRDGGCLDTRLLLDLTPEEKEKFAALVADEKAKVDSERVAIREKWIDRQVSRMVENGAPEDRARATLQRIEKEGSRFDLDGDFILEFASGETITVREAIRNPSKYNVKVLADPFEGPGYGQTTAKLYTNNNDPVINSHAHGGMKFFLHEDLVSSKNGVSGVSGVSAAPSAGLRVDTEKNAGVSGVYFPDEIKRPCYGVYESWCGRDGKKPPGVYYHSMTKGSEKTPPAPIDQWICDPLYVDAFTRDERGDNHGLMLRFLNKDNRERRWNMPTYLLEDGAEMRRELLRLGLRMDIKNKPGIPQYINSQSPKARMKAALQVGWSGCDFVLPEKVISAGDDGEPVFFQSEDAGSADYSMKGSLDEWRDNVAALCIGNPLLMLGVSAAFAGALLKACDIDGAGFHIFGSSSCGKSSIGKAAASVWGAPKDYVRSWKATANGLEGACCLFNDGLLILDELGDGGAQDVERTVYALHNGRGKQRAKVTGAAKSVRSWRILTLSNGEKTLDAHLMASGLTIKPGQLIRLLQIPVFGKSGAFDELRGHTDGKAFVDTLVKGASQYYGAAGVAYLQKLTAAIKNGDDVSGAVQRFTGLILKDGMSSQEKRAAPSFAVVAAAGEYATDFGVTGWKEGAAFEAARVCFHRWREHWGDGDAEERQILSAVVDYTNQWGDARFSDVSADESVLHGSRAGYWREGLDGREWLFTSTGLREAVKGYEIKRLSRALFKAQWLKPSGDGKMAQKLKVRGEWKRLYVLRIPVDGPYAA